MTGTQQWEGDETCDQAGRGLHVHEVTVLVNPQWEGGMRHVIRLAGACMFMRLLFW